MNPALWSSTNPISLIWRDIQPWRLDQITWAVRVGDAASMRPAAAARRTVETSRSKAWVATRELGGTLGVAVFGSVFASAYGPKIIRAFGPLPIPAAPKIATHQSMAAALAVVGRAPKVDRSLLQSVAFSAFGSGLKVACVAGAGVAVLGALGSFRLLPGRTRRAEASQPVLVRA